MRTATVCLAAWAAASGVRGASAAEGFKERTSGRCTDESGWGWVESIAQCEEGARALGWGGMSAGYDETFGKPRGCYKDSRDSLYFNSMTTSKKPCHASYTCVCTLTCRITDGSAPNTADNTPCTSWRAQYIRLIPHLLKFSITIKDSSGC